MDAKKTFTPSNAFADAYKLMSLGYSVIPSGGGKTGKEPRVKWKQYQSTPPDGDQLEKWETELKPTLWGILTTDKVAVIDADTKEARALITTAIGEPHVTTPRAGAHWYIDTDRPLKSKAGLVPGVDIRGVGGFANIAGGDYQILRLPIPGELIPLDKLPRFLMVALNGNKPKETLPPGETIPEGQRNEWLASQAGSMRANGLSEAAIEAALQVTNREKCNPPLEEWEIAKLAKSIAGYPPNKVVNNNYIDNVYCPNNDVVDTKTHKKNTGNAQQFPAIIENDRGLDQ